MLFLTGVAAALFLVLTMLVATHATDPMDSAIRQQITPVGTWSSTNQLLSDVPDWASPSHTLIGFGIVATSLGWRRRSWQPLLLATLLVVLAAVPVVALKWLLHRADTGNHVGASQGSFPSGHMAITTIVAGGVLLLLSSRPNWWQWTLVALAPAGMASCLLGGEIHWATDVVGGALIGLGALSVAALARCLPEVTASEEDESAGTASRVRPGSSARP